MIVIEKKPDGGIKIHVLHDLKFKSDVVLPYVEKSVKNGRHVNYLVRDVSENPIIKNLVQRNADYFFVDNNPKPKDLESRKQLYWENDPDGNPQVKVDTNWEKRLMPDQLIKRKHIAKLNKKLSDSLDNGNQDVIECLKLKHEIDMCKSETAGVHNENKFWASIALKGLDDKVANGESDKPLIRKKLRNILNEKT